MTLRDAINKYIDNARLVRAISSVPSDIFLDQEGFYQKMISNFQKIREISNENQQLLDNDILPFLEESCPLSDEESAVLEEAVDQMINGYSMENLDVRFVSICCDKLLSLADKKNDANAIVKALDISITVYYTLMNKTERIEDYTGYKRSFRNKGIRLADRIMEYMEMDKFKKLSKESRELVLIDSRYMSSIYEGCVDPIINKNEVENLLLSESFIYNDEIRKLAPKYKWINHQASICEYLGYMTEKNNRRRLTKDLTELIHKYCERLYNLKRDNPSEVTRITEIECIILLSRSSYANGDISLEEYKKQLMLLYRRRLSGYAISAIFSNLLVPCEYMLVLDKDNLSEKEVQNLKNIYENTLAYASNISASETMSYILEYYSLMLDSFIEIEGMSFDEFVIRGMAAFHLPTYVHSHMVARLAKCIMKNYIESSDILSEIDMNKDELLDFTYNSGRLHDVGKLPIIDTVSLYERKLFDDEFNILKTHPLIGYKLLNQQDKFKKYANVCLAHHLWYDESDGYPLKDIKLSKVEKLVADVITCADCMDAATDVIGRSYRGGISLDKYILEYETNEKRYAKYLLPALHNAYDELVDILDNSRKEYYYEAFESLYD